MSDDLIRRSDAIKATWQEPTYTDPLNVLTEVRDRIEAIPSVDRPQEWIPCSERMPENGNYYLWCSDMGSVQSDYYWNGFEKEQKYGYNIVAWMPLPEPWKGADDE